MQRQRRLTAPWDLPILRERAPARSRFHDCDALRRSAEIITLDIEAMDCRLTCSGNPGTPTLHGTDEQVEDNDCAGKDHQPVVWFEVEDFLRYFDHFRNPTGSQRVPFEIFVEAERLYGRESRVRFCRLSVYTKRLIPIDFGAIISAYLNPPGARAPWKTVWASARFLSEFAKMAPVIVRNPRFFLQLSKTAVRDLIDMAIR